MMGRDSSDPTAAACNKRNEKEWELDDLLREGQCDDSFRREQSDLLHVAETANEQEDEQQQEPRQHQQHHEAIQADDDQAAAAETEMQEKAEEDDEEDLLIMKTIVGRSRAGGSEEAATAGINQSRTQTTTSTPLSATPGAFLQAPGSDMQPAAKARFSSLGNAAAAAAAAAALNSNEGDHRLSKADVQQEDMSCSMKQADVETPPGPPFDQPSALTTTAKGDSSLAVARAVTGQSGYLLPIAQEAKRESSLRKTLTWNRWIVTVIVIVLVGIVTILLAFLIPWKEEEEEEEDINQEGSTQQVSSNASTGAPTILTPRLYVQNLLPDHTVASILQQDSSPQAKALEWILQDPKLMNLTNDIIIQRFALATIFYATNGQKGWLNETNWLSLEIHECQWFSQNLSLSVEAGDVSSYLVDGNPFYDEVLPSITRSNSFPCDEDQSYYSHLWLYSNNLLGQIPPELYLLTSLQSIIIGMNPLDQSTISTQIGRMTSLEYLSIINAGLEGTLPTEMALLTSITSIHFARNNLHGTIPTQLAQLSNILSGGLDVYSNKLQGTIPSELGALTALHRFLLSGNLFSGTIPTELFEMGDTLYELCVGPNMLTGTLPTELGSLKNLGVLWMEGNQLSGWIPSEIGKLHSLEIAALQQNQFTGWIPSQFSRLVHLEALLIRDNYFSGTVPQELSLLAESNNGSLMALDLHGNQFSGEISLALCGIGRSQDTCPLAQHIECFLSFDCSNSLCGCNNCPCPTNGTGNGTVVPTAFSKSGAI